MLNSKCPRIHILHSGSLALKLTSENIYQHFVEYPLLLLRIPNSMLMNIPSAIVPPRVIGAYMVRVRANIIATHMLVLRNARNSFLQDDNQQAALLVHHMYHHWLNSLVSGKMLLFKGLPSYDIDAQVNAC